MGGEAPVGARRGSRSADQELWKSTEWRMLHMKASPATPGAPLLLLRWTPSRSRLARFRCTSLTCFEGARA